MVTVCEAIAAQYERDTSVRAAVWPNAPFYHELGPLLRDDDDPDIRLVHHGCAIPPRPIEAMIEMMRQLDERFQLDMLLVTSSRTQQRYYVKLKTMAEGDGRIRFLPPVPRSQLVAYTNCYDLGVFLLPPTSFSYLSALPNTFVEFIQARLGVAIGPSPEMTGFTKEHDCGVVATDFEPRTLAECLESPGSQDNQSL